MFASLRADQRWFFRATTVALILRTFDSNLYHRFIRGDASDLEVVESVFARAGGQEMQWKRAGRTFETTIITGFIEQQTEGDSYRSFHSPLLEKYKKVVERNEQDHGQSGVEKSGDQPRDLEYEHARDIVRAVENLRQKHVMELRPVGFSCSVQRLELFSRELMGGASGMPSHDE